MKESKTKKEDASRSVSRRSLPRLCSPKSFETRLFTHYLFILIPLLLLLLRFINDIPSQSSQPPSSQSLEPSSFLIPLVILCFVLGEEERVFRVGREVGPSAGEGWGAWDGRLVVGGQGQGREEVEVGESKGTKKERKGLALG